MGRNLTNLYISQSFEFLVQLSGSELQNGLGQTITGSLAITSSKADTATSASFATTASYVASVVSASYAVSSSFSSTSTSASYASSALSSSYAVTASYALNGGGGSTNTGSLLVTASAVANIITFTKGDGSTFPVIVATGSAVSASFATTASLALNNVLTASNINATITYTKGDGTTFNNVINNVVNASSASVATSASYAVSASNAATANTATTASYVLNAVSASYAVSASQTQNAVSASYAVSASTATTANTATTASYVLNAVSASYAVSASQAQNAVSASYYGGTVVSASYAVSASQAQNAVSASVANTANTATSASYAVSASQAQNAVSSSFAVSASWAPSAPSNPFPYTGSAQITGSLGITGSMILGIQQNDTLNPNGIIAGNNNLINGPSNVAFLFAGNSVMNSGMDYGGIFGGIGHRLQHGYSHIFGGNYNYIGYNAPGPNSDVYAAGIFGGANNTINGYRSNNQTIIGGSGNQIYTYNAAADFEPNATIVGGRNNYISGSYTFYNTIVGGFGNFIGSGITGSTIIGGTGITASHSDSVYVPNLRATQSIITEGSTTSANPAMILASGSGRPLYFYAGGGINPTFDVESNQAIYNWVAGGTQCYQVMGLSNAWYFGYNWGGTPTVVMNANNIMEVNYGLQVSGSVRGNVKVPTIASTTASFDCATANFFAITLPSTGSTQFEPSNIQPGQTINVRVTQGASGGGVLTFPASVKQASGSSYIPTATGSAVDVLTFVSFDTSSLYLASIKNFV